MGEIADMMLEGVLCQGCGEYMGEGEGYPGFCSKECAGGLSCEPPPKKPPQQPRNPNSNRSKKRAANRFRRAVAECKAKGLL